MRRPRGAAAPRRGLRRVCIPILCLAALAPAGARAQTPEIPPTVAARERGLLGSTPEGLPLYLPFPKDNPLMPMRVALGRRLFFDPALSADRSVSCTSCHRPAHAFADTVEFSRGTRGRRPTRNAPSLLNAGYAGPFFWDGRTETLEKQVVQPIANPREMGLPLPEAVERLRADAGYRRAFREAFGDSLANVTNLARALASYLRTLRSGGSPADRFAAGDVGALSPKAQRGYRLFVGKAGCTACHGGAFFTNERFHNTGVGWGGEDTGRARVTGRPEDRGRFNTPSLRNVAETAPYMHDGSIETLRDVVAFYDRGGGANPNLDRRLKPLGLTSQEADDLLAFLDSLGGRLEAPDADRRPVMIGPP